VTHTHCARCHRVGSLVARCSKPSGARSRGNGARTGRRATSPGRALDPRVSSLFFFSCLEICRLPSAFLSWPVRESMRPLSNHVHRSVKDHVYYDPRYEDGDVQYVLYLVTNVEQIRLLGYPSIAQSSCSN
jgi:hypothetical protein